MAVKKGKVAEVISHWNHLFEDFQKTPKEFYAAVEAAVREKGIPKISISRVSWKEGGLLSNSREYLRVQWKEFLFDICAAPYGNGYFVSWWLAEPAGCLSFLARIPYFGEFLRILLRPVTYFQIDTALMFQSTTHAAVLEVIDDITTARGITGLTELERKPILREFYNR